MSSNIRATLKSEGSEKMLFYPCHIGGGGIDMVHVAREAALYSPHSLLFTKWVTFCLSSRLTVLSGNVDALQCTRVVIINETILTIILR